MFSVAFSPDSRHLASGSRDKTVRVVAVPSGRDVAAIYGQVCMCMWAGACIMQMLSAHFKDYSQSTDPAATLMHLFLAGLYLLTGLAFSVAALSSVSGYSDLVAYGTMVPLS